MVLTIYEAQGDVWASHISSSINPVPSDSYTAFNAQDGTLCTLNQASKEMAGGLVSLDKPLPANTKYTGLDIMWNETEQDLPHKGRNEMDLKWTFPGGLQANGSCQWNATNQTWDLDPTGSAWVHTPFTLAPSVGINTFQLRLFSDGTKWSVTGMRMNGTAYQPSSAFQNLPMIPTNWGAGLHPQLQTECSGAPWFLRSIYQRVRILASDSPIPFELG